MVNSDSIKNFASFIFTLLMLTSCSEILLTPVTVEYDTESATETSQDTDTAVSADSETTTATMTHPTDSTETPTDTPTDAPTDTDTDSDTDTYKYTDTANFRHVGYAGAKVEGGMGFPNDLNQENTVVVTDVTELVDAIDRKGDAPLIIYVEGQLIEDDPEHARILIENKQNLYIIGRNGGSLTGVGLNIRGSAYVLIQNLKIHNVPNGSSSENDCLSIAGSHHIWIDHCEVYNDRDTGVAYDSLLDITEGSDYITVSWNHFHNNRKGLIIGNSDNDEMAAIDTGKLHVTYHHNIFRNISEGMVSVRFGEAHIFNNYFLHHDVDETIAISSRMGACVRAELNRFRGVTEALKTDQSGTEAEKIGEMQSIQNVDEYGEVAPVTPTCELKVEYAYEDTLISTELLEGLLGENVGVGILD